MQHKTDMMICCSFGGKAGNFGMKVHNEAAAYYGLDFLYKSFAVESIKDAMAAMRTLKFRGAAVTMPFKEAVRNFIDEETKETRAIGACNTVLLEPVFTNEAYTKAWNLEQKYKLVGHNTDWIAAYKLLSDPKYRLKERKSLIILGNGGYAKAVAYAAQQVEPSVEMITLKRDTWGLIPMLNNNLIFNCTPVENIPVHPSNDFIDCVVGTETGNWLALEQAKEQFFLYTGRAYPF